MNQTPVLRQKDDLLDKIERYYLNEGKLTDNEKAYSERLSLAFSLLLEHKVKKLAIQKYLAVQKEAGNPISDVTAYRDFSLAEKVFVPLQKYNKEFLRLMIINSAQADIDEIELKLKTCKDNKMYIALMDQKDKCRQTIIKAGGLMMNDANIPDFSNVQPPDIQINVSPKVEQLLAKLVKFGMVDTSDLKKDYSDFEEVNDEQA